MGRQLKFEHEPDDGGAEEDDDDDEVVDVIITGDLLTMRHDGWS